MKTDCMMKIKVSLLADGQHLSIEDMNLNHNHEVSEQLYKHLPRQKRLNAEEKEEIDNLLQLKCDKKLVKDYISDKTGKIVILKDIQNMKQISE